MFIKILDNKEDWNKFLDEVKPQSFLQDYEWGEVEKNLGREIFRLGIYNDELIGICQIVGYKARRGNFLLIPHGPALINFSHRRFEIPPPIGARLATGGSERNELILGLAPQPYFENQNTAGAMPARPPECAEKNLFALIIQEIINFLKRHNYHKKYTFLRLNSSTLLDDIDVSALRKIGFHSAPTWTVSDNMWVKNLEKTADELLNEMSITYKKLIIDSVKKPYLEIGSTTDISKIDDFWKIYSEFARRKEFTPYARNLIKNEFEIFAKENKARLYFGKVEGRIVSSALIIYAHKIAFYHHGANLLTKEPISHKIHWQIMLDAKNMGCEDYNMWGGTLSENPSHPWQGLTQFKKNLGCKLLEFLPTMDYPFSKKYLLNYFIETIRKKSKRL